MQSDFEVKEQSKSAYKQWCVQWRENAKTHSKYKMNSFEAFENIGIGKACLVVANGASFEQNIDIIKKYQKNVDIFCCDKTLGHLLDNGIKPTYCLVCDANVSYEKYLEPWRNEVHDIHLMINVCGNPEWTEKAKWKNNYFFVNMDSMQYEKEFISISGCKNRIPAATNVSNAQVVMITQSNNHGRNNFFGYDKILLIGFDYSWEHDGNYYSFNKDGDGKHNYMRHVFLVNQEGNYAFTSSNLLFSAKWLDTYVRQFKLPVVQCSKKSIVTCAKVTKLEEQIQYQYKAADSVLIKQAHNRRRRMKAELAQVDQVIQKVGIDHYYNYLATTH